MHRQRVPAVACLLASFTLASCDLTKRYARNKYDSFTQDVGELASQPKTPEQACQRQGGTIYNGQCYAPDTDDPVFDRDECYMLGGLFIDEECLFVDKDD